jgi:FkbM family methyltransferase
MYRCSIHIFEPVVEFAEKIEQRFRQNPLIRVYRVGMADRDATLRLGVDADGSSLYKLGQRAQEATLVRAADFLRANNLGQIDVIKINIEGAEYDLLDHLIETNCVATMKNIQVQFHDFVADAEERSKRIQQALSRSHTLTYQYPFVWENWRRKN